MKRCTPVPVNLFRSHAIVLATDAVAELVKQLPGRSVDAFDINAIARSFVQPLMPDLLVSTETLS